MSVGRFLNVEPKISCKSFIAQGAQISGAVEIGDFSSIWHNVVLRADINTIKVGSFTNIQDGTVVHVSDDLAVVVDDYTTVGHGAQLHACSVGRRVLIGIGAIVLNGAEIGEEAQVAAGALVPPGMKVSPRALVMGVPAKVVRFLTPPEIEDNVYWADKYAKLTNKLILSRRK